MRDLVKSLARPARQFLLAGLHVSPAVHGINPPGRLRTPDGAVHDACNWPDGATPFDTHEGRDWIVQVDGEPCCPPWIRDLVPENETAGLRVVGAPSG